MVLAAVLVGVIYLFAFVPLLPARKDPVARGAGWENATQQVAAARTALPGGRAFVGADRYQDVSELAFHLPDHPQAFCVCLAGRHNQYELWPGFSSVAKPGDALVLLLDERKEGVVHESAAALTPYFGAVTRGALVPLLRGGDTVTVRRVWTLAGYRGGWPVRSGP
jgi:hypothetical protein